MKSFVVLFALVAVVAAEVAQIVSEESKVLPKEYSFNFETSNGIKRQEYGVLKKENNAFEVQGSNSYPSQGGKLISLSYVANEYGYQPQGAHLPVPPPVPAYILRALDFIAAHPPKVEGKFVL